MRGVRRANASFHSDEIAESGHIYLLKWLQDRWSDDAAKHIVWQFIVFYGLLLLGFVFLYVMIKSTGQVRTQLKEIRRNMVDMMNEQKARKWDLDDYNKSAIGTGFM